MGADLNDDELDFSIIALEDDEKELFVNGNIVYRFRVQLRAVSLELEEKGANGRKLQGNPSIWQICKLALIAQHHKNLLC